VRCVAIMAGGRGSRVGNPEKMLIELCGRPLISILIEELSRFYDRILVITSKNHINLIKYLRDRAEVDIVLLGGESYSRDLCELINVIRPRPLLVFPSDIVARDFSKIIRAVETLLASSHYAVDILTLAYEDGSPLGISVILAETCHYGRELSWSNLNLISREDVLDIDYPEDYDRAISLMRC